MHHSEFLFEPYLLYNGSELKFLCHNVHTIKFKLKENTVFIHLKKGIKDILIMKSILFIEDVDKLIVSYTIDEETYKLYKERKYYKMYVGVRASNIKNNKFLSKELLDCLFHNEKLQDILERGLLLVRGHLDHRDLYIYYQIWKIKIKSLKNY
jgi:hypothetical protein